MAINDQDAMAAGLELYGIRLKPMTIKNWSELDKWMQSRHLLTEIRRSRDLGLTGQERLDWFTAAQRAALEMTTGTKTGMAQVNTHEGFLEIIKIMSEGTITEDGLAKKSEELGNMTVEEMVGEMGEAIIHLSSPSTILGDNSDPDKKKASTGETSPNTCPTSTESTSEKSEA